MEHAALPGRRVEVGVGAEQALERLDDLLVHDLAPRRAPPLQPTIHLADSAEPHSLERCGAWRREES